MKEIIWIGPLHTSLLFGAVTTAVTGVLTFILSAVPSILSSVPELWLTILFSWIYLTLAVGAGSFFSTALGCVIYNLLVPRVGGIKVTLR